MDKNGKKFSKSNGNYVAIEEVINEEGICTYQDKYTLETSENPKIKKIYPIESPKE